MKKALYYSILFLSIVSLIQYSLPRIYAQDHNYDGVLNHDGQNRTYYVYMPSSYNSDESIPLVVVLHPSASSGKGIAAMTGFDAFAETNGFIAVYPDSLGFRWNDGRPLTPQQLSDTPLQDDLGFINALIDELSTTYNIDQDKVFLSGFANGGAMAFHLICQSPDRFKKVFIAGTLLWNHHIENCSTTSKSPDILLMIGSEDAFAPLDGVNLDVAEEVEVEHRLLSFEETLDFWVEHHGCDEVSSNTGSDPNFLRYENCEHGVSVNASIMPNIGHNWLRMADYALNQFGIDMTAIATHYFLDDEQSWVSYLDANQLRSTDTSNEIARNYTIYVPPSYDASQSTPLVVALHGRPDSGYGIAYLLDMNQTAQQNNFVVVYPHGIEQSWNYTRGFPEFDPNPLNDTEFLTTLVDDLALDLNIDRQRVYVTGFSNGGFMTQRLACETDDTFAAFAVIGAAMTDGLAQLCEDKPPVNIMFIHGTHDESIPWGGLVREDGLVITWSIFDTLTFWTTHNGCSPEQSTQETLPHTEQSSDTSLVLFTFGGCINNMNIPFYIIEGGGHNIPGVSGRLDTERFGAVNMDMRAPDTIWEFFEQITLRND